MSSEVANGIGFITAALMTADSALTVRWKLETNKYWSTELYRLDVARVIDGRCYGQSVLLSPLELCEYQAIMAERFIAEWQRGVDAIKRGAL